MDEGDEEEDNEDDNNSSDGDDDETSSKKKRKKGGGARKVYRDSREIKYKGKSLRAKNMDELKTMLAEEGIAICQNVIPAEKCKEIYNMGVQDFQKYTGGILDIHDPETYGVWRERKAVGNMIVQDCGHARFQMEVRVNKKIHKIYKGLYEGDGDLVCSTEGACLSLPFEDNKGFGVYRGNCYMHMDKSLLCSDSTDCFRSWVNLRNTNDGDASMMYYEKSHLLHKEFKDMKESLGHDMSKLKKSRYQIDRHCKEEVEFFKGCRKLAVKCKAGDLVIYDARLFKKMLEPSKKREKSNIHMSAHLCMQPRSLMTKGAIKRKREHFYNGRTSNHDPVNPQYFPKKARVSRNHVRLEDSGRVVPDPFPVSKLESKRTKRLFCVEDVSEEEDD